jgi:ABC-type multidrug transport system permease subunit
MKYRIVFITTLVALFWDECMLGLFSYLFKQPIDTRFMIIWIVLSGVLAGVFVSFHLPEEYRSMTLILIGIAVLFSLNGHHQKKDHGKS